MKRDISFKLKLCYNSSLKNSIENKDVSFRLIKKYQEIVDILKYYSSKYLNFLYFNKKNIHKILYDYDEILSVDLNEKDNIFSNSFYLCLLIMDNPIIMNYKYSINCIYEILNLQSIINEKLKKLIISKIVNELINYYIDLDKIDENKNRKELERIKKDNINIIKSNINFLKEFNLKENEFFQNNIDEIYILIIISLIKNDKFSNYEYAYNIINQLNLEHINISHAFFNVL